MKGPFGHLLFTSAADGSAHYANVSRVSLSRVRVSGGAQWSLSCAFYISPANPVSTPAARAESPIFALVKRSGP